MEKMTLEEARALSKEQARIALELEHEDQAMMLEAIREAGRRYQARLASGSPDTTDKAEGSRTQ